MFRALKVSYSDVGEGRVALNCEKKTFFPEHPVKNINDFCYNFFTIIIVQFLKNSSLNKTTNVSDDTFFIF